MIGIIPHVLAEYLQENVSDEVIDKIQEESGLETVRQFRLNKLYPDEEWQSFLGATQKVLDVPTEQLYNVYADAFMAFALGNFKIWFMKAKNSYEFLTKQPKIHNSIYSGISEAEIRNDKFTIKELENKIITYYNSPNRHCGLYIALAKRILAHFGDEANIEEHKCLLNGDDFCEIHIEWIKLNQ